MDFVNLMQNCMKIVVFIAVICSVNGLRTLLIHFLFKKLPLNLLIICWECWMRISGSSFCLGQTNNTDFEETLWITATKALLVSLVELWEKKLKSRLKWWVLQKCVPEKHMATILYTSAFYFLAFWCILHFVLVSLM